MFKILRSTVIAKPLTWIIIVSFMVMTNNCSYFKVTKSSGPPASVVGNMQNQTKYFILHDGDKAWHITDLSISDESIKGIITPLVGHQKYLTTKPTWANRYKESSEGSEILNEVHIYVSKYSSADDSIINIPVNAVEKIEVYERDDDNSVGRRLLVLVGVGVAVVGIIYLVILSTKSSCPFVYTFDGSDFHFTSDIFSGAVQPGLERDDYLPLKKIATSEGVYKLKLTNEVHEIQSVNFAKLIIVDHPESISVLYDKNGMLHSFKEPIPPVSAKNNSGLDILPLITDKDTLSYSFNSGNKTANGVEEIILKFTKPYSGNSAKFIIRAKTSFWLDMLFAKFNMLFGEKYNAFAKKQESQPGKKLNRFLLDQKIPLLVYIEKGSQWQLVDYFNVAGPMTLRENILPLDLSGVKSDTIKIKLETGYLFWDLDYTALDFSKNESLAPIEISVKSGVDKNSEDTRIRLLAKDNDYLVLKEPGDESLLFFDSPVQTDKVRSVFLHTRGYYKILRDQSGPMDKRTLRTFKKPGRFPQFSNEMYDLMQDKKHVQ